MLFVAVEIFLNLNFYFILTISHFTFHAGSASAGQMQRGQSSVQGARSDQSIGLQGARSDQTGRRGRSGQSSASKSSRPR